MFPPSKAQMRGDILAVHDEFVRVGELRGIAVCGGVGECERFVGGDGNALEGDGANWCPGEAAVGRV